MPLALFAALAIMAGCQARVEPGAAADTSASKGDRMAEIAGDKTMTADVMHQSHEHGTFDDALALAMRDSALAADVIAVVRADPRFAGMFGPTGSTGSTAAAPSRTQVRSVARTVPARSTSNNSGDVLDKAERTVQKANEKIDQAARVKKQADDARHKVEGILHP